MGWSAAVVVQMKAMLGDPPPGHRLVLWKMKITRRTHMEIHAIGIDLGKTLFHLVAVDSNGSVVVRKRCSRSQLDRLDH
jgi:hypothetical protein